MFIEYSDLEVKIFNKIRLHFEKMEPLGSQDYKNGFSDIIAQYSGGGQSYMMIGDYYDEIVEDLITDEIEKLNEDEKREFKLFYENHFMMNYIEGDEYIYINEELAGEVFGRFKCWVDDNYSEDDLLESDDVEEDEEGIVEVQEFDEQMSGTAVEFIREICLTLLGKEFSKIEKRRLQVALIYLAYHPLAPEDDYVFRISFKSQLLYYQIEYCFESISLSQFCTDDGSVWYDYKFLLTVNNYREEEGEILSFTDFVRSAIDAMKASEICISNELI